MNRISSNHDRRERTPFRGALCGAVAVAVGGIALASGAVVGNSPPSKPAVQQATQATMIDRFRSQWGPCLDDFNYNPFRPAPDHTAAMQLGPDGTLTLSPVDPSGYSADGTPVPPWTTLTTPLQEDQDEVTGFRGDAITFHFVGGQWYPDTVASYVLGGSTCDLSTPSGNPTPYPAP